MSQEHGRFRWRSWAGALVAGIVLALAVPTMAFAATATFSGKAPTAGVFTANPKPKITVAVSDRYGVSGSSNYSITLDGVKRPTSIHYTSGRVKFTLSYQVVTALSSGSHTVSIRVKDAHGLTSTTSWTFMVDATAPTTTSDSAGIYRFLGSVHLFAADNLGGSGVANTFYHYHFDSASGTATVDFTSTGNIVNLAEGQGVYYLTFWSVDKVGNVESRVPTITITTVGFHAMPSDITPVGGWTGAPNGCFQTGCHLDYGDLAGIHMNIPVPAGQDEFSAQCGVCHGNGRPLTAECNTVGCHSASDTVNFAAPHSDIHVTTATILSSGAGAASCTQSTCHGTNLISTHSASTHGCATCHAPVANSFVDPTLVASVVTAGLAGTPATCESCHGTDIPGLHAAGNTPHTVATANTCVTPVCHLTDASVIHVTAAGPDVTSIPGCTGACHNPSVDLSSLAGIPTCTGAGCHPTGVAVHLGLNITSTTHTSTNSCAAGGACHSTDVVTIHTTQLPGGTIAPPGCIACHDTGVTPSTNCSATGCHDGITMSANPHAGAATPQHSQFIGGCMSASCHGTDISLIHNGGVSSKRPGCSDCHSASQNPSLATVIASFGTTWNNSGPCATCHTSLNSGATDPHTLITSTNTTATPNGHHSSSTGLACSQCHDQSTGLKACNTPGCHLASYGTITRPDGTTPTNGTTYTPTTLGNEFGPGAASQHNAVGNPGGLTKFDGTTGSNGVVIKDSLNNTITATWALPTVNVFKAGALDDNGVQLGWTSAVSCQDCHTGNTPLGMVGPHGSSVPWLLDPNYTGDWTKAALLMAPTTTNGMTVMVSQPGTAALAPDGNNGTNIICAKCHDLYNPGTSTNPTMGVNGFSNTAHGSHHEDPANDKWGQGDCIACHVAVPHGWTRPRLILYQSDAYPYKLPNRVTGTNGVINNFGPTATGIGGVAAPVTSVPGFNAISSVTSHSLNASGGVLWGGSSGQDCQACLTASSHHLNTPGTTTGVVGNWQ